MIASRRLAFALALGLAPLAGVPAHAADSPAVVARPAKTEVTVGEPFVIEVRASGPPGTTFEFPPEVVGEAFEVRAAPADSAAAADGTRRYLAAVFAIGDAEVPALPVRYRLASGATGEVRTAPITVRVVSLLPKEPSERRLAEVRGPVDVGIGRAFWIAVATLALLVAGAAWWIARRRRRPAPAAGVPAPAVAPDEEARRALEALVASGRLARGEYRPFYIELTAIAKRYLERRLAAPIVEMTTAEMLAHLRASPPAADLASMVRDLSGAADQIKFARGSGLADEAERHLGAARAMIDTLEARLAPRAPGGEQAA